MEEESFLRKRMMRATQISKCSQRKKVAAEEEDITRMVEVEEEARRLSTGVTDVTNWVTNLECPKNEDTRQRGAYIDQTEAIEAQVPKVENLLETGEVLMMYKVLLKLAKEIVEPVQRKSLFKTMCKAKGKCCKLVIENESTDNLLSQEMVEKLGLKKIEHPTPYKVLWLQKGHQLLVQEQSEFEF